MDPNTTLDMLLAAIAAGDFETAREYDECLSAWLARGGSMPQLLDDICDDLAADFDDMALAGETDDDADYMDFRIYIRPDGALELAIGDPSYDADHRGFCGAGTVCGGDSIDNCRAAVLDCFNDAIETAFQSA